MIIKIQIGGKKKYALIVDDVVLYVGKTVQEIKERVRKIKRK